MALTLTIENETALPDGGPLSVTLSGGRGLDIGRDQHLDWSLPDPTPRDLRPPLRDPLPRRRLLAARRLDQRHLCQWQQPAGAVALSAPAWRPARDRPLHHRGLDRRCGAGRRPRRPRLRPGRRRSPNRSGRRAATRRRRSRAATCCRRASIAPSMPASSTGRPISRHPHAPSPRPRRPRRPQHAATTSPGRPIRLRPPCRSSPSRRSRRRADRSRPSRRRAIPGTSRRRCRPPEPRPSDGRSPPPAPSHRRRCRRRPDLRGRVRAAFRQGRRPLDRSAGLAGSGRLRRAARRPDAARRASS